MVKPASVIEINGDRYDAVSGRVIGSAKKATGLAANRVIDGFVKRRSRPQPKSSIKKAETTAKKPARPARTVKSSAKAVHHRTQRSETLRRGISRPSLRIKEASKTFARPVITAAGNILPERERRAKLVDKHNKVNRFGVPRPVEEKVSTAPEIKVVAARPRPNIVAHAAAVAAPASMVTSASHQKLERMLDAALINAKSHKETSRRNSRNPLVRFMTLPRWLSWTIILLAVLAAIIFVLWRDVPAVAVKVASNRAHVNAVMPGYSPVGFGYAGPVSYSPGSVSINFKDRMNASQTYTLMEKKSNWNSASLSTNILGTTQQFQTSQVSGNTVYIYGPSNDATWINNGMWYTIRNQAGLSSDQLLRIVQSL